MSKEKDKPRVAERTEAPETEEHAAARVASVTAEGPLLSSPIDDLLAEISGPHATQDSPVLETGQWALAQGSTIASPGGVTRLGAGSDPNSSGSRAAAPEARDHGFHEAPTRPDLAPLPDRVHERELAKYRPLLLHGPMATARTFGSLVPTRENQPIIGLVERLATERSPAFNPVFIWSELPLGKTHLLEAAASRAKRRGRIVLTSATDLEAEVERATRERKRAELRSWLVASDLLIIDDVQDLEETDPALQALLVSVLDALVGAQCPVLLAGKRAPASLGGIELSLRARCGGGVVLELRPPEPAEREELLRRFLADEPVDDAVIPRIAAAAGADMRALRALANQLLARAALWEHERIDLALADRVVQDWRRAGGRTRLAE